MTPHTIQQIACQQVLVADNTVFSVQWLDLPAELGQGLTPEQVLERYLAAIQRLTLGLIRPRVRPDGVQFLLANRLALLCFLPPLPEQEQDARMLALRICGGLLVQTAQCDRGELRFSVQELPDQRLRVTLRLSDYCPLLLGSNRPSLLRRWLYRLTQALLHRLVTIRFLRLLYRDLGGTARSIRTTRVSVQAGRPT